MQIHSFTQLMEECSKEEAVAPVVTTPEDLAYIMYTSGSSLCYAPICSALVGFGFWQ